MNPGLLVKLRPAGPWRIGPDSGARNRVDAIYHSDALYSAVTSAMSLMGSLDAWLDATARNGVPAVCFSSCFPFLEDVTLIVPPRTIWPPAPPALSARVRWKSARFVPLEMVRAILAGHKLDEERWSVDGPSECLVPAGSPGPFRSGVRWNAAVDRLTGATERHSTACIEFRPGAGLWTIVSFSSESARERWMEPVKAAFRLLADTGFGGERSRGWGRAEQPEFVEGALPEIILPELGGQGPGAGGQGGEAAVAVSGPEIPPEPAPAPPVEEPQPEPPIEEPPAPEQPEGEVGGQGPGAGDQGVEATAVVSGPEIPAEPKSELPVEETPAPEQPEGEVGGQGPGAGGQGVEDTAAVSGPEIPTEPPVEEPALQEQSEPVEGEAQQQAAPEIAPMAAPEAAEPEGPAPESPAAEPVAAETPEAEPSATETPAPGPQPPAPERGPELEGTQPHWLLSLFLPATSDAVDWGRGNYTVVSRGGRVESPVRSGELKKQVQMVTEGSVVFAVPAPHGSEADVAPDGFEHPVYRAGFAVSIPLPEAR
jgi:CRISPR type III-A-associated RAMP protein Csm4